MYEGAEVETDIHVHTRMSMCEYIPIEDIKSTQGHDPWRGHPRWGCPQLGHNVRTGMSWGG